MTGPMVAFASAWVVIVGTWLAHETAPTRRRNAALRRARKNAPRF